MKTLMRIVLLAAVACAIYFATVGNKQFYRVLDAVSDFFQAVADNYLRK